MKIVGMLLVMSIVSILMIFNLSQISDMKIQKAFLMDLHRSLAIQGREFQAVSRMLSWFPNALTVPVSRFEREELMGFQHSDHLKFSGIALPDTLLWLDWKEKLDFFEHQAQWLELKQEFTSRDMEDMSDEQIELYYENWFSRFTLKMEDLENANLVFFHRLSQELNRDQDRLVLVNFLGLFAILILGISVARIYYREKNMRFQSVSEELETRNKTLKLSLQVLTSQSEDLEMEREKQKSLLVELQNNNVQMDMALDKLRKSNEQLERFAFICSHDLQEPIRMVQSFSQLLERKAANSLDEKSKTYLTYITEGAVRARELIKDILDFCRLDQVNEAHEEVSLSVLCKQVTITLSALLEEREAEVHWPDDLPSIIGVQSQIFQLLLNLIGNGVKFNRNSTPTVPISAEDEVDQWVVYITDNGIGIDPQYVSQIFKIFNRLNSRTEFPGTGIGLAICKKIADHHNAEILVDTHWNPGSRFVLRWPKVIEDSLVHTSAVDD